MKKGKANDKHNSHQKKAIIVEQPTTTIVLKKNFADAQVSQTAKGQES